MSKLDKVMLILSDNVAIFKNSVSWVWEITRVSKPCENSFGTRWIISEYPVMARTELVAISIKDN